MASVPVFELLGGAHLLTIAVTVAASLAVPFWARGLPARAARGIAVALALGLVIYRTGWIFYRMWSHGDPLPQLLPLGVCPLLFYLCAWVLWKPSYAVYEVAYFWAIGGTLQALFTPDVRFGFPHPEYLVHFASHGALILAVLYPTVVYGLRPRPRSILRVLALTVAYAAVLLPLNLALGTNHMYLVEKPAGASLLDHLGPWPWYNLTAIGVALILFVVAYIPFAIVDLVRKPSPA